MIQSDCQLRVVREQLATAEDALDALRDELLPENQDMYRVMAESYIEMILSLRAEVDAYLGISSVPENADLVISLEGDRVGLGRTSARIVTRFIDTFRRGLQSAVAILEPKSEADSSRRRERWIERSCDLPIVGLAPGSVKILLGEPQFDNLFSNEDSEPFTKAVDLIFQGLNWADTNSDVASDHPFEKLDKETQQSLLAIVTQLLPPSTGDVERVAFKRRIPEHSSGDFFTSVLTRESRGRIRKQLESLAAASLFAELSGVIRSVDLDAQTFVLRERPDDEPDLNCEYGTELEDSVKESLDCQVLVSGTLETSKKTKKKQLAAESIEILSEDSEPTAGE